MRLKNQIPNDFYKLFHTKNREQYITILVSLYQENMQNASLYGLTEEECKAIMEEIAAREHLTWSIEESDITESGLPDYSVSDIWRRLLAWGWIRSEYDEKINRNVCVFPEYSQLYIELFEKLQQEAENQERESMLNIYSALFTYRADGERNNEILRSALLSCKRLGQMLSGMQDGMRNYFDALSRQRDFIGIQKVLIAEINNSDSKKYAILTTTDSFYRYKEAVKELVSEILDKTDLRRRELTKRQKNTEEGTVGYRRLEFAIPQCEDATKILYQVEREFVKIERRYTTLVEQKSVFAQRALARVHYIMQEGSRDADSLFRMLRFLEENSEEQKKEVFEQLGNRAGFTRPYRMVSDDSLYRRKESAQSPQFQSIALEKEKDSLEMEDFVPKPLYTKSELRKFQKMHTRDGVFCVQKEKIQSIEDLEKLLFLWQEASENREGEDRVTLGEEQKTDQGFSFTDLQIKQ